MNTVLADPVYAQLQQQIHDALLLQHPEWILPDGTCPTRDAYEARFVELLMQLLQTKNKAQHFIPIGTSASGEQTNAL